MWITYVGDTDSEEGYISTNFEESDVEGEDAYDAEINIGMISDEIITMDISLQLCMPSKFARASTGVWISF